MVAARSRGCRQIPPAPPLPQFLWQYPKSEPTTEPNTDAQVPSAADCICGKSHDKAPPRLTPTSELPRLVEVYCSPELAPYLSQQLQCDTRRRWQQRRNVRARRRAAGEHCHLLGREKDVADRKIKSDDQDSNAGAYRYRRRTQ